MEDKETHRNIQIIAVSSCYKVQPKCNETTVCVCVCEVVWFGLVWFILIYCRTTNRQRLPPFIHEGDKKRERKKYNYVSEHI